MPLYAMYYGPNYHRSLFIPKSNCPIVQSTLTVFFIIPDKQSPKQDNLNRTKGNEGLVMKCPRLLVSIASLPNKTTEKAQYVTYSVVSWLLP